MQFYYAYTQPVNLFSLWKAQATGKEYLMTRFQSELMIILFGMFTVRQNKDVSSCVWESYNYSPLVPWVDESLSEEGFFHLCENIFQKLLLL